MMTKVLKLMEERRLRERYEPHYGTVEYPLAQRALKDQQAMKAVQHQNLRDSRMRPIGGEKKDLLNSLQEHSYVSYLQTLRGVEREMRRPAVQMKPLKPLLQKEFDDMHAEVELDVPSSNIFFQRISRIEDDNENVSDGVDGDDTIPDNNQLPPQESIDSEYDVADDEGEEIHRLSRKMMKAGGDSYLASNEPFRASLNAIRKRQTRGVDMARSSARVNVFAMKDVLQK